LHRHDAGGYYFAAGGTLTSQADSVLHQTEGT
jgi:hypothetical protein